MAGVCVNLQQVDDQLRTRYFTDTQTGSRAAFRIRAGTQSS